MTALVLGPCLRYVDSECATVWVETDGPCEVEILGHTAQTFSVEGHHYALVLIEDLTSGESREYQVSLDGRDVWPEPDSPFPPSTIRPHDPDRPFRLMFGSCRVAAPHEPPYTDPPGKNSRALDVDALYAAGLRMIADASQIPDAILFLGDQVYADDSVKGTREFPRDGTDESEPPADEPANFEEYTLLYLDAWSEPVMRWVLSTVQTTMIFDDHDVHDDWNTSGAWVEEIRRNPWWQERIVGALASYWVYQHLGNLSPSDLRSDPLFEKVRAAGDATSLLREYAARADLETNGTRWSYHRDFGRTRLIVIDSRCGRVLDGERKMVDDEEFDWIAEHVKGDFDHLLLASSVPFLLLPALHHIEAWSEAVCDGAWGKTAAKVGEKLRQAADLEHWAAFGASFERLSALLADVSAGRLGRRPASVVMLSGDVHHAYLAQVDFPPKAGARSPVYQAVCSPVRNPLPPMRQRIFRASKSSAARRFGRWLARRAKVPPPVIGWTVERGPWFYNQIAELRLDGRTARLQLERAERCPDGSPALAPVMDESLT